MSETERSKTVIVVGVDGSEQSSYALRCTLEHLFSPFEGEEEVYCPFAIFLLRARPTAASVLQGHRAAPGAVETDPGEIGDPVIATAERICKERGLQHVHSDVREGDAGNVLCEAVERYPASMLVVGSDVNRAVLGSVSDYCARHARRPVMIVNRPNILP